MMETGRTPFVAILVSALALIWPVWFGTPRTAEPSGAARAEGGPSHSHGSHHTAEEGKPAAGDTATPGAKEEAPLTCEQPKILLRDAACDRAFARFVDGLRGETLPEPDGAQKDCWQAPVEEVDRVIAMLPDPLDTGMQTGFDQGLDAIMQAMSTQKYLLSGFWSPWHNSGVVRAGNAEEVAACSARVPGVFAFRNCDRGPCRRAELYVVGESPTSGARQQALRVALILANAAAAPAESDGSPGQPKPVRIIGPTFSGSTESLREGLVAVLGSVSKPAAASMPAAVSKSVDAPKGVVASKPVDAPKGVVTSKPVDAPKGVVASKPVDAPKGVAAPKPAPARPLQAEPAVSRRVVITTGTASARSNREVLENALTDPAHPGEPRVSYSALVLSANAVQQGFFEYLRKRLPEVTTPVLSRVSRTVETPKSYRWFPHVALFSEEGTAFGMVSNSKPDLAPIATDQSEKRTPAAADPNAPCDDAHPCHPALALTFPLHLSAMRAAFSQQTDQGASASQTIGGIRLKPTGLQPETDVVARLDSPTALSRQTSVIEDLVLAEQTHALAEEDVRVIGLFASDAADALFLARHLRRRIPNARIFVFDYDLAFDHPDYAQELRGTLLMSSYPSTARADQWVYPYQESQRRVFPSPAATGQFNAALWGSGFNNGPEKLQSFLLGYGMPFVAPLSAKAGGRILPALWISAVGASGVLPVGVVQPMDDGYATPIGRVESPMIGSTACIELDDQNVFAGMGWSAFVSLLCAACAALSVAGCFALFGFPLPIALRWMLLFRRPDPTLGPAWRWRAAALVAITGHFILVLALLPLVMLPLMGQDWCRFWAMSPRRVTLSVPDAALLGVALVAGCFFAFGVLRRVDERTARPSRSFVFLSVSGLALVFYALLWPVRALLSDWLGRKFSGDLVMAAEIPLSYLRWTSLGSQLSPVVPALLLALMLSVAAGQYLVQARFGGKQRKALLRRVFGLHALELPKADPRHAASRNLDRIQDLVMSCVSVMRWPYLTGVLGSVFVILVVVDPPSGAFGTLERRVVTWVLGGGFAAALIATAGTVAAALTLAGSLGLFLKRLRAHPLGTCTKMASTDLGVTVRLPFASLPDANEEIRVWLSAAHALSETLPESHPFRAVVASDRVEAMLHVARSTDVVAALRVALEGIPPMPPEAVSLLREHWAEQEELSRPDGELAAAAQRLAGVHVLLFVFWAIRQLRTMAGFSLASSLLLALGVASYPFEPARVLSTLAAAFVIATLVASVVAFVVLERDPLLSDIAGTARDRIEWNRSFVQQVVAWVVLPFLAFLATQYPDELRTWFGWATPYFTSR